MILQSVRPGPHRLGDTGSAASLRPPSARDGGTGILQEASLLHRPGVRSSHHRPRAYHVSGSRSGLLKWRTDVSWEKFEGACGRVEGTSGLETEQADKESTIPPFRQSLRDSKQGGRLEANRGTGMWRRGVIEMVVIIFSVLPELRQAC